MGPRDRLLAFLEAYWAVHGYGPSLEEIRRHLGFSSRSHVLHHLRVLLREGRIAREPGKSRTWRPVSHDARVVRLPLAGVVPASFPDAVDEIVPQPLGQLALPAAWVPRDCRFALWVRGDSMIGVGIQPFDIVLIEPVRLETLRWGDLVVVRWRDAPAAGEMDHGRNRATLKQLFWAASDRRNGQGQPFPARWILKPAHPALPEQTVDPRAVILEGRVAFRFGPVRELSGWVL